MLFNVLLPRRKGKNKMEKGEKKDKRFRDWNKDSEDIKRRDIESLPCYSAVTYRAH